MGWKRLVYTSDPYEPSGTIGVYDNEASKQEIIEAYILESTSQIAGFSREDWLSSLKEEDIELNKYLHI